MRFGALSKAHSPPNVSMLGATCGAKKKVRPSVLFISMGVLHGVLPAIFKEDRMTGIWDSAQNFMKALWFIGFMDAGVAVYLVYFGVSHVLNNYIPHMFFQCFSTLPPKCCQVSGHELFNGSNFGTMGLAGLRVYVCFFLSSHVV